MQPETAQSDARPAAGGGRRRRILKRLVAVAIGLVAVCFVFEGLVLLVFGEQPKFPRCVVESDFGLRINLPGSRYRHKSADVEVWFDINEQGMRADRDYAYAKPAGTKRIVSLGDSFTIGYEVDFEECFSSVLERELRAAGHDVQVLNAGVSGYSNAEEYLYLERELFKYDPDVVLVSFYANDLVDNVRSGLFALQDGELVQLAERYVPLGTMGNLLNTNWFLIRLSERSNAFALLKESITTALKGEMVEENLRNLDAGEGATPPEAGDERSAAQRRLAGSIFERIYAACRERNVPLVIHSIPAYREDPKRLVDMFPFDDFDLEREGVHYVKSEDLLEPRLATEQIYFMRSHYHWTPVAHEIAGKAIAAKVLDGRLFDGGRAAD